MREEKKGEKMKNWLLVILVVGVVMAIWDNRIVALSGFAVVVLSLLGLVLYARHWAKRQLKEEKFFREFEERMEAEDKRLRQLAGEIVEKYGATRTNHPIREIFSEYFYRERISLEDIRQCSDDGLGFVAAYGSTLIDEVEEELEGESVEDTQLLRELEALM